jgi:hypothetical protein
MQGSACRAWTLGYKQGIGCQATKGYKQGSAWIVMQIVEVRGL